MHRALSAFFTLNQNCSRNFGHLSTLLAMSEIKSGKRKRDANASSSTSTKAAKTVTSETSIFEGKVLKTEEEVRERDCYQKPLPEKNSKGVLVFQDAKEFHPNLSPKEVLQSGSFGGTYFRPIQSSVTGLKYNKQWLEFPQDWFEGLDVRKQVAASVYNPKVNRYAVKCGGDLDMWEGSGWIKEQDPYGWFHWYCRYYLGRRTEDDSRQLQRWKNCTGPKGRWKNTLIGKCVKMELGFDNIAVSPVIRQTLQHWGYRLTKEDFEARKKILAQKK